MVPKPDNLNFAPVDPSDGRADYEWESRYPTEARRRIAVEACYLTLVLLAAPVALFLLWTGQLDSVLGIKDDPTHQTVARYGCSWLAGTVGGSLFAIKWLYHTVARGRWHADRLYWRLLTPHLSGGLAFGIYAIASSSIFVVFNQDQLESGPTLVGLSFLVGLFSDNATAALARLADRLFGERQSASGRLTDDDESDPARPGP